MIICLGPNEPPTRSFEHLKSSFKYTNLWWHLVYTIWVSQITYSSHLFLTFANQKSWILQLPAVVSSKLNFPPAFTKHAVDTIRLAAVASCEALKPQSTMTGLFPPGRLRCRNDTKKVHNETACVSKKSAMKSWLTCLTTKNDFHFAI